MQYNRQTATNKLVLQTDPGDSLINCPGRGALALLCGSYVHNFIGVSYDNFQEIKMDPEISVASHHIIVNRRKLLFKTMDYSYI